jgi:hypothetical protein
MSNFMKISPVGTELFSANRHKGINSRFSRLFERRLNARTDTKECGVL